MTDTVYFKKMLLRCYQIAQASPDTSTQNGAIIVDAQGREIGAGCNEFTKGIKVTPELLVRPLKYLFIEHAERNAVFDAVLEGNSTREATMFAPWAACADCARAIVQSGITTVVRHADAGARTTAHWAESLRIADQILRSGKVEIVEVSGKLGAPSVLHSGVRWNP
jgi:dCMP deaminase